MVECDCEGDRVKCSPKNDAERALETRHFVDCISGCECNPRGGGDVVVGEVESF